MRGVSETTTITWRATCAGRVQDVDCALGAPPCMQQATDAEFVVREVEVTFWGICASCREAENDRSPTRR